MYSKLMQAAGKCFSKYIQKLMFMNFYVTFTDHTKVTVTTNLFLHSVPNFYI